MPRSNEYLSYIRSPAWYATLSDAVNEALKAWIENKKKDSNFEI